MILNFPVPYAVESGTEHAESKKSENPLQLGVDEPSD